MSAEEKKSWQEIDPEAIKAEVKRRYLKKDQTQDVENLDISTDSIIDSIYRDVVALKRKDFLLDFQDNLNFLERVLPKICNSLDVKDKSIIIIILKKIRLILTEMEKHWQKKEEEGCSVSPLFMVKGKILEIDELLVKYS